ncbi:MAG: GNAT family N-acetyltransferase [Desulfobacula sp.]|nr:GNAT family N-acetyltransferase [Desulfobacula sp.]
MSKNYEGENVYLKLLTEEDIDDRYVNWFKNVQLTMFYSGTKRKYDREYLINDLKSGLETGESFIYGIYVKEDNKLIGNYRISKIHKTNNTCDVSIIIGDTDYHGKGLAVDAFKVGNYLVFNVHDIRKISSGMYCKNLRSYKALMKAGWLCEGRRIGHYLVEGKPMDQLMVACFSPKYFDNKKLKKELKKYEL